MDLRQSEIFSTALWEQAKRDSNIFLIKITSAGKQPITLYGLLSLTPCFLQNSNHSHNNMPSQTLFDERAGRITIPMSQKATGDGTDLQVKLENQMALLNAAVIDVSRSAAAGRSLGGYFINENEEFHEELAGQRGVIFSLAVKETETVASQVRLDLSGIGRNENCTPDAAGKVRLFAGNFNYIFPHLTLKPYV